MLYMSKEDENRKERERERDRITKLNF